MPAYNPSTFDYEELIAALRYETLNELDYAGFYNGRTVFTVDSFVKYFCANDQVMEISNSDLFTIVEALRHLGHQSRYIDSYDLVLVAQGGFKDQRDFLRGGITEEEFKARWWYTLPLPDTT